MNFKTLSFITGALALAASLALQAQPVAAVENINITLVGGHPLSVWFPNVFDPLHPKYLYFEGSGTAVATPTVPAPLKIKFDWLNPSTGGEEFSNEFIIQPNPGAPTPIFVDWWLPWCPERVSIHFETDPGTAWQVEGVFVHQCIPEPEMAGGVMALGLAGLAGWRWHRRRNLA